MKKQIKRGGFERRLLVFFLILSVVPTLLIAFFGARYFVESFERVGSPALKESARNSMEIARKYQAKLEQDAEAACRHLVEELRRYVDVPGTGRVRDIIQLIAEEHQADFVALYTLRGSEWSLAEAVPSRIERADTTMGVDLVSPVNAPQKIIFSDQDVIAWGVRSGSDSVFVAGFLLDRGTMEMMRRTGDDLSRYSSMPLYVRGQGIFLIFVITAIVVILAVSSVLVSRLIARRISQPIQELALATERIARGDLDHRVSVNAKDEIQSLVTAFNDMTEDLQEYKKNLLRAERIAAWRDVARRIAHEIKNPLTPIEIAIYRMRKRFDVDREESKVVYESLDSILKQVAALRKMAEEFSAFAKLPEPRFAALDVNEAVRNVLTLYASSLEVITVDTDLAADLPSARADGNQIRGVLGNLVKNAVEALGEGGRLTIRTSHERTGATSSVRVEVIDTGPGIPEDIRDRIFDPYFTTKARGTGLGLALAYRIIQDHGGSITFVTGSGGTTFRVDLPLEGPPRTGEATEDGA
jgi:nitrogen fixation/metabolism regulation signal transduction histidine kinase